MTRALASFAVLFALVLVVFTQYVLALDVGQGPSASAPDYTDAVFRSVLSLPTAAVLVTATLIMAALFTGSRQLLLAAACIAAVGTAVSWYLSLCPPPSCPTATLGCPCAGPEMIFVAFSFGTLAVAAGAAGIFRRHATVS